MASWKEKGEVPDSDDEDDDSQETPTEGHGSDFPLVPVENQRWHERRKIGYEDAGHAILQDYQSVETASHRREGNSQQLSLFPRVFEGTPSSLALQELPESQQQTSPIFLHCDDETVHSSARLSSSLSMWSTPPFRSQELDDTPPAHNSVIRSPKLLHGSPLQYRSVDWAMGSKTEILEYLDESSVNRRRSLRQRNPIQLHPYALEGEKYRRTLIARGMRPLRLTQVQESGREPLQDQNSIDQAYEAEDDSQILSLEDGTQLGLLSLPSNSVELPDAPIMHPPSTQSGSEDEEFPDIDQLLDRSNERFIQAGQKRRKRIYGSERTFKLPSVPPLPRGTGYQDVATRDTRIGNVPPSPPTTSSPTLEPDATFPGRHEPILKGNLSSSKAVILDRASPGRAGINGDLPTPDTGLAKHAIDLTTGDDSGEDPFLSESDSSTVSLSSKMDQSIQVRRVGKNIRGVLPASWLRLDQQTHQKRNTKVPLISDDHRSVSPTKVAISRRGVAIPKNAIYGKSPVDDLTHDNSHFVLSDSESDELPSPASSLEESAPDVLQDRVHSQTDISSVMEDNRVDPMLPSRKRQTKLLPKTSHRRKSAVATSLFTKRQSELSVQSKITDHLQKTRSFKTADRKQKRKRTSNVIHARLKTSFAVQECGPSLVSKLSILDAIIPSGDSREQLPIFIRIAARNARTRRGLGRHSPTRKFIKLANRTDTHDAQSVLREWREGTLRPCAGFSDMREFGPIRRPLSSISPNVQNLAVSAVNNEIDVGFEASYVSTPVQRTVVSRSWMDSELSCPMKPRPLFARRDASIGDTKNRKVRVRPAKIIVSAARPAQLETSEKEYLTRDSSLFFGSAKKALDKSYRKAHQGDIFRGDVQLARFFGNEDHRAQSNISISNNESVRVSHQAGKKAGQVMPTRRRKQFPHRLDVNAAAFRQPDEPLMLESLKLDLKVLDRSEQPGKLIGLGTFGTKYTYHFDIFPLQSGVFFHQSTFIGSGELFKALETPLNQNLDSDRGYCEFQLAGKKLRWGPWDENVSSEFGMCFDWITEQLEEHDTKVADIGVDDLTECMAHTINYVNTCLSFPDSISRRKCLSRGVKILSCFIEQLETLTKPNALMIDKPTVFIDLWFRAMIIAFQFLKITRSNTLEMDHEKELETLLQRAALQTISLLLSLGLAPIRQLYDDLQYEVYREAGISGDRYSAQAWVIVMHIVHAARIPRASFWDLVNLQFMKYDEEQLRDARILENIWYDMFSLLPLMEFNMNGILIPGDRSSRSFENWALPQRIIRKVFELYNSKSSQSASFNTYCRTLFSRCAHLMETWYWRRHGVIIGTLFDFFAVRNLAHLRNEEVYTSPRFLLELHKAPSLVIGDEDRCFHILLKMIAISIRQMRETGDNKGIRNLITRVLPNHDRQYPREKNVRQRDLACLRNHHDLLCTLFWAAPPEFRPSITLIRELVNPENSHLEAYLINLRAWENLTQFILANAPTPTAYLPFAVWHNESFLQLLAQLHSAEKDVQEQLQNLPVAAQQLISQHTITTTVQENRKQIIMALVQSLDCIERHMYGALDIDALKIIFFNPSCLVSITTVLSLFRHRWSEDMPLVRTALSMVDTYTTRLIDFANGVNFQNYSSSEDSQEYGSDVFVDVQVDLLEYVGALNGELMACVRDVLRFSLNSGVTIEQNFRDKIVEIWAKMAASLILAKSYDLSDFFAHSGPLNELKLEDKSSNVRHYAPYFLGRLAAITGDHLNLGSTNRDHLSDWLCIIIRPAVSFRSEHVLLPLFAKCEPVIARGLTEFLSRQAVNRKLISDVKGLLHCRGHLTHEIIRIMHLVLQNEPSVQERYEGIIRMMLNFMKSDMDAMHPQNADKKEHQKFVISIHSSIRTWFGDWHTIDVDQFSIIESDYPNGQSHIRSRKILATIRNYGLRLSSARGKSQLNHYVLVVLKYAAMVGNLCGVSDILQEAMCDDHGIWADISHYFLTVLSPSFIHAAFVSEVGWLAAEALVEAMQEHLMDIVDRDTSRALEGVDSIMASIVQGVYLLMKQHSANDVKFPVHNELLYMLLVSTRFMVMVFNWLPVATEICGEHSQAISKSLACFYHFACGTKAHVKFSLETFPNTISPHFPFVEGCVPDFSPIILADYRQDWSGHPGGGDIEIKVGNEKGVAKGLGARQISLEKICLDLQKSLDEYIICYEKIYGIRSASQFARLGRKEYDTPLLELIL